MKTRKPLLFFVIAIAVAVSISYFWKPVSYAEQLVRVQARQELGHFDKGILKEPIEVQAVLLDYAGNQELVLKAWIALSRYPEKSREIILQYGAEPEFQEILLRYGESIIPVIQYFRENDVWSIKAIDTAGSVIQSVNEMASGLWNSAAGDQEIKSTPGTQLESRELGPKERGWYAVNAIKQEGHDLLGQFVVSPDKQVKRNQTDRFVKALTSFFTSGIRTLEAKHDLGDDIATSDVFWAGLDVALIATPVKLLKAGKAVARSGKEFSLAKQTRLFAPRLLSRAKIYQKLGKYGAVAATAYIIVTNPGLFNSAFGEIARSLGLPPWLGQLVGWFLVIGIVLYPFSWILGLLARAVLFALSWLEQSRKADIRKIGPAVARA